jgi:hypothetical protein
MGRSSGAPTSPPPPDALDEAAGAEDDTALPRHHLRDLIERNLEEPRANETGSDGQGRGTVRARFDAYCFDRPDAGELSVHRESLAATKYRARHPHPLSDLSVQPCRPQRTPWVVIA